MPRITTIALVLILLSNPSLLKLAGQTTDAVLLGERARRASESRAQLDAMRAKIADPDEPISDGFLWGLVAWQMDSDPSWDSPAYDPEHPEAKDRFWVRWQAQSRLVMKGETQGVLAALPRKTASARALTLHGLLLIGGEADPALLQKVRPALIAAWQDLPEDIQQRLVEYRWPLIDDPGMLPNLRRMVATPRPQGHTVFSGARDAALIHIQQFDPSIGHELILRDLQNVNAQPSLQVVELLPPQDIAILLQEAVERFTHDRRPGELDAPLIDRYGDAGNLKSLQAACDRDVVPWWCNGQPEMMRYFLRVAPEYGAKRVVASLRALKGSATYTRLLTELGDQFAPVQQIAIAALDDPNPEIVLSAVMALGRSGTADVEPALWARLQRFHKEWAERQAELKPVPYPDDAGKTLEQQLVLGIATNKNWICPPDKLARLSELVLTDSSRENIQVWTNQWKKNPAVIRPRWRWNRGSQLGPVFDLLQYSLTEAQLHTKLGQLPRGTQLTWQFLPPGGRVIGNVFTWPGPFRRGQPDEPPVSRAEQDAIYERIRLVAEQFGIPLGKTEP